MTSSIHQWHEGFDIFAVFIEKKELKLFSFEIYVLAKGVTYC